MNTYVKFAPNVFIAKCEEAHDKGETITVTTKRGKENESIIHNLIAEKDGYYYYSIVRADGYNAQTHAQKKVDKLKGHALNAQNKSDQAFEASNKDRDFLSLGEPIKVGHHSERRHRKIIEEANRNMQKSIDFDKKADEYNNRAEYWEARTNTINLSMPESLEYYKYKLEKATQRHADLKSGKLPREHSFSLTYAKKEVNETEKLLKLAVKLWG